jgi:hypothetical protein
MIYQVDCQTGKITERAETPEELDQIEKDRLAALPKPEELVADIMARLEKSFWNFAKTLAGEPEITQLKLKNWDDKYLLSQKWASLGQPDITKDPKAWAMVVSESSQRTDAMFDANILIAAWLKNGFVWKSVLDWYYFGYEPSERGRAYAALAAGDVPKLESIGPGLEDRLQTAAQEFLKSLS